jgi:hypothetical protein
VLTLLPVVADCCAGVQVTPEDILHTPFTSLSAFKQQLELQKQQAEGQAQAAAAMEVEGAASGDASSADANGNASVNGSTVQGAAQQQILGAVLEECLLNSRVEVSWHA